MEQRKALKSGHKKNTARLDGTFDGGLCVAYAGFVMYTCNSRFTKERNMPGAVKHGETES